VLKDTTQALRWKIEKKNPLNNQNGRFPALNLIRKYDELCILRPRV